MAAEKEWAYLPNAAHIDRVITHLKANPARWSVAWSAARDAAWGAARDAVRGAARDAAWGAARDAARGAAWGAVRDAVLALVAYDDCAHILDLPSGAVRLMVSNAHPAATLLYPAVLAMKE